MFKFYNRLIFFKTDSLAFAILFLFCTHILTAQSETQQHVVSKGDNVYRISLRYGVSIESIYTLNPRVRTILVAGETILIPKNNKSTSNSTGATSKPKSYVVVKGDTKYQISKKYAITISDLEDANPQIIKTLTTGTVLKIPNSSQSGINSVNYNVSEDNIHIVKKGETLSAISKQYDMSLIALRNLNPQKTDNNVKDGEQLIVKFKVKTPDTVKENNRISNTHLESSNNKTAHQNSSLQKSTIAYRIQPNETLYGLAKKAQMDIDDFLKLNPSLREAVQQGAIIKMPKTPSSNTYSTEKQPFTNKNNTFKVIVDWNDTKLNLTPRELEKKSRYLIGLKKAIDSVNKLYPFNNVTISSKNNSSDTSKAYKNTIKISSADSLEQKPVHYSQSELVALDYNDGNSSNKILINSIPTTLEVRKKVLSYLKKQNGQVICIYDKAHAKHIEDITTLFPEVVLISCNKFGYFESNLLIDALKPNKKNFVIIESDIGGLFLSSTNILLKEFSKTNSIQLVVLNANNIPSESEINSTRFTILKLLYPQVYNDKLSQNLNKDTALGFAVNYDLFQRLYKNGIQSFDNQTTSSLGYSFSYKASDKIFTNTSVKLFVYDVTSNRLEIKY